MSLIWMGRVAQAHAGLGDGPVDQLEVAAAGQLLELHQGEVGLHPGGVAVHEQADGAGGRDAPRPGRCGSRTLRPAPGPGPSSSGARARIDLGTPVPRGRAAMDRPSYPPPGRRRPPGGGCGPPAACVAVAREAREGAQFGWPSPRWWRRSRP